ncbi:AAA family ATPase (plasmid) [Nitratidesulfovibrio vulgaris]|jgi:superfamily I DNA/RNA helicase|nr:UvrD-helicase domain-containing protein [Nitratidesulfovibrio vulgaris]WCB48179.1 AAA family ATPase [Nitratidesulfovibrio vulgaris]
MSLTDEQSAIIQASFGEVMCVTAYAGSGKTYTLQQFAKERPAQRMLYLAFNKAMATEAAEKFARTRVEARTVHSLAYKAFGHRFGNKLGDLKAHDVEDLVMPLRPVNHISMGAILLEWLGSYMSSADETPRSHIVRRHADVEEALAPQRVTLDEFGRALERLWSDILEGSRPVPHNAYLKLYQLDTPQLPYDYILVDEAQDVTDAMINIVLKQRAKKIFIGDPYQQIYAWNGAVNALQKLGHLGYPTLYLSRSFRCPQPIADIANQYLRLLGATKDFKGIDVALRDPTRAFLARCNATIFDFAAEHYKDEVFHYLGGFAGYEFKILLDMAALQQGKMEQIHDGFVRRFATFEEFEGHVEESKDAQMRARAKIARRYRSRVSPIYFELESRQSSREQATITLSTAHKAKGQEFGHITLADDFLNIPALLTEIEAGSPIEIRKEELNLLYVTLTRTKGGLSANPDIILTDHHIRQFREHVASGNITLIE